jgi:hypothetical protein
MHHYVWTYCIYQRNADFRLVAFLNVKGRQVTGLLSATVPKPLELPQTVKRKILLCL